MKNLIAFGLLFFLLTTCQQSDKINADEETAADKTVPDALSLKMLDYTTLQLPPNWKNVGTVSSDLQIEKDLQFTEGTGILACLETGEHLNTGLEHGDIDVAVKVLIPKNSNSGIYFQGRYELQILDSWKKEKVNHEDLGGIYAHTYDEALGTDIGGVAPAVNAAKAPGLWQDLHILFRAPKFDANGTKTENAKFEYVYLNGHKIQENIALEKPTIAHQLDGEAAMGPIFIQGDHGPVAFKEFKYKKMGTDTVAFSNVQYALYKGHWDTIPDFAALTPVKSGKVDNLNKLEDLAGQKDKFGMVFTMDIDIPKNGEYLFTTLIDDGGDLFIDSTLVVHNLGEPGLGTARGLIELSKGKHQLKLTYFEEVWLALAVIYVEGPEMPKKTLASFDVTQTWGSGNNNKAKVAATEQPALLRGFVDFKGTKKTHALTVGDPSGIHYSYDLRDGTLLKSWRGDFADVTNMWVGRGESQTLLPENAAAEFSEGVPVAQLSNADGAWPEFRSDNYKNRGYRLDPEGRPIFLSSFKEVKLEDRVIPNGNGGLSRKVNFTGEGTKSNLYFRIAKGGKIVRLANGLYSVDGDYYLKVSENTPVTIRSGELEDELVATAENQINYELIW